jgi:hypothetical protein
MYYSSAVQEKYNVFKKCNIMNEAMKQFQFQARKCIAKCQIVCQMPNNVSIMPNAQCPNAQMPKCPNAQMPRPQMTAKGKSAKAAKSKHRKS